MMHLCLAWYRAELLQQREPGERQVLALDGRPASARELAAEFALELDQAA
jgi:hypothetical protein